MKKFLILLSTVLFSLLAVGLAFVWYIGGWNVLFPSSHHDEVAGTIPDALQTPAILLFSKTNSFRHKQGIRGGNRVIVEIAREQGWGVFATENGAVFNERDLARFDVVVFQNASGDMLSIQQEEVFQRWLEEGGGWLGIHAAGDGSHAKWQWYMDNLIGVNFIAHTMNPQFQFASITMEVPDHLLTSGIPPTWGHEEEWYSWEESARVRGFQILATVDEDSYSPAAKFFGREIDLRMGDHPVVWSNCIGHGRSVYSALGHKAEAFDNPHYRQLLSNVLAWLMRAGSGDCRIPE